MHHKSSDSKHLIENMENAMHTKHKSQKLHYKLDKSANMQI